MHRLPCTLQDMQPRSLPVSLGMDFGIGCRYLISNGKETQSTGPVHSVSVRSRPWGALIFVGSLLRAQKRAGSPKLHERPKQKGITEGAGECGLHEC